LVLVLGILF